MNKKIGILHLEDSLRDSELIHSIIESGNFVHEYFLADNEKDFNKILETENINIIISDYSLPDYSGQEALKVAREKYSKIPFIFVSGKIGEDSAITAMLNGATDYVFKNKLERLVPAITRALNEQKLEINRNRAEANLKKSEERFKAIFNEAPTGIALVETLTGKFNIVNPMFAKILGRTVAEIADILWINITHPDDAQLDLDNLARLIAGEINGYQMEKRYVRPDGSFVWVNMTISHILYDDKLNPLHLCMIEDISERKQAEIELKIANKELVFQNKEKEKRAEELIIANKELAFQNKEKEKRADELNIANKELEFQNDEKEKRAAELIIANKELAFQNKEKEKRADELDIANKELVFQNGEKEKRASELIIAKEKAEESDNLKTAFLQNISHEIRTPLNGVIGFSTLLNEDDISKDEIREYTALITQSGKRLIEIVNNVLDISKIQTGQMVIEKKPVLIDSVFKNLTAFFAPIAKTRNISFNYHNQDIKDRTIFTDEAKVHQVLENLINNAIKFTKLGTIDYGYEIKADLVQMYVKDTGIGIPQELHGMIFDRFIQAELSMTRSFEGAGLGLAISKALVELMGGKIWVESEPGKGSIFFFNLPYKQEGAFAPTKIESSEIQIKPVIGKILIAEDDWISFKCLQKILSKFDVTIIHAENGEQAVEFVRNTPDIDLIFMDIRMPVMDGIEATKLIKQIRPDLPVIAQTAYALSEEKSKILSVGCNEYLTKPLEFIKLKELINLYMN